jgi:hypothetical protein
MKQTIGFIIAFLGIVGAAYFIGHIKGYKQCWYEIHDWREYYLKYKEEKEKKNDK